MAHSGPGAADAERERVPVRPHGRHRGWHDPRRRDHGARRGEPRGAGDGFHHAHAEAAALWDALVDLLGGRAMRRYLSRLPGRRDDNGVAMLYVISLILV